MKEENSSKAVVWTVHLPRAGLPYVASLWVLLLMICLNSVTFN